MNELLKLSLFCLVVWIAGQNSTAVAQPKLESDRMVFDFGIVEKGANVSGSFTLRNNSDAELSLKPIRVSCPCLRVASETLTVAPHESRTLAFTLSIGPSVGNVGGEIHLASNDPPQPALMLTVRLYVQPDFTVTPSRFDLGEIAGGEKRELVAIIRRTDGQDLRVTNVVCANPAIITRFELVKGELSAVNLIIEYTADTHRGNVEDILYIHTGEEFFEGFPKPSCDLTITARIRLPWQKE